MSSGKKTSMKRVKSCETGFIKRCCNSAKSLIYTLLFDANSNLYVCAGLLFFESILLNLIILNVPYTEIDYGTYMQQIEQIESGELNYSKIGGDTGPIVYPGGYVFIYSWMKVITNGMENIDAGQHVFKYLYLFTMVLTFAILLQIKGRFRIPPIVFMLLTLSKRLHSIYVLRLFNDCFTTLFMLGTVFFLQMATKFKRKSYKSVDANERGVSSMYSTLLTLAAIDCYSVGVSIKMNGLLYFPGLLVVLYFLNDENTLKMLAMLGFGVFMSYGMNYPFLSNGIEVREAFLKGAFDFKRKFLYKWSVNWKMLDEKTFLSDEFHWILLVLQVFALVFFGAKVWFTREMTGKSLWKITVVDGLFNFYKNTMEIIGNNFLLGPNGEYNVVKVMFLSNLIGVLFSRSLHYQFLCWYMHSLPFLLYDTLIRTPVFPHESVLVPSAVTSLVFVLHEWAWNVYPSTAISSTVLISILFAVVVGQLLFNRCTNNSTQLKVGKAKSA